MNEFGSLFKIQFLGCIGERFASIEWIDASGELLAHCITLFGGFGD